MDTIVGARNQSILARAFTSIVLYRNYRLLWMGSWTEHLGEWMETTALLWLLNQMTNSPFMGTLLVTLRFAPLLLFAFVGGIVADRLNRRLLLIYALLASALLSIAMAALVHFGLVRPWHLLVYSALSGLIMGFNHPARNTLLPNLVKKEHYLNAITLDNASVTASRIVGGPLAGFIIAFAGTTPVLGLRGVGALLAIFWLSWVRAPATPLDAKKNTPLSNLVEGIHYVGQHRAVLTQVLLYLLPFFVTNSYTGLLPYFATNNLHIGPDLYGILNAAPGAGALLATFTLAALVNLRRKGLILLLGGIAQGAGLIFFAASSFYPLSLFMLAFVGAANTVFMTLNNVTIQEMITDQVRGRVMSLREVCLGLGPSGSLISGAIAGILGAPLALGFTGGLSITVLLSILIALPQTQQRR
jgi:predicted MFS family arabinose efflux permease